MSRIAKTFGLACMAGALLPGLEAVPARADIPPEAVTWLSCRACHDAPGRQSAIPPIAGWPAADLAAALLRIRSEGAAGPVMHRFAAGFSTRELEALAIYISGLEERE